MVWYLFIKGFNAMLISIRVLAIYGLLFYSSLSFACISAETLCHQQREAIHDMTHYRTFVLFSNKYWTGNPSGYFEELYPSDDWDPPLRNDGRAREFATRMIDDELQGLGIIKADGAASEKIREDHIVNDVNLFLEIIEQLDRDGESIFFVEAKLEIYEPVITLRYRQSNSLVMRFNTSETAYDKSDVESTVYDVVEQILSVFSDYHNTSLNYCIEAGTCNPVVDIL